MALTMLTSGAVLLLVALAFVVNETMMFRTTIRQELTALARFIGMNTTAAITFEDRKSAEVTLQGLEANPHILAADVLKSDGTFFAAYRSPGTAEMSPTREMKIYAERRTGLGGSFKVTTPILLDDQEIGTVVIWASSTELLSRLFRFLFIVFVITIAALIVAYKMSTELQRPIAEPILALSRTMKSVTKEKNYALRVDKQSDDEIGQLIEGFNDMLSQIQKRDEHLEHFASELKENNEELKAFVYSAAHDLRQPLVNIKGFSEEMVRSLKEVQGLLQKSGGALSEHDRRSIDAIFQDDIKAASGFVGSSVESMSNLIDALLKLSQVGNRDLKPELLLMNRLVESVLADFAAMIREKGATVVVEALPDVTADRIAIQQIVGNILDNALKYLVPGRPGQVKIAGERSGNQTIYHIQDNGRGIGNEDMPKLFKMFRRLGVRDVRGQGVGLAYVKALVRRQGGNIWCESELGKGSVFSFTVLQRREGDR